MTAPETPAALLRRAAGLIRERLAELPPSPWQAEGRDVTATQDYEADGSWDWGRGYVVAECPRQDEAEHVAAWGPPVAVAVAEWLDAAAQAWDEGMEWDEALNVARVYLNEPAETSAA